MGVTFAKQGPNHGSRIFLHFSLRSVKVLVLVHLAVPLTQGIFSRWINLTVDAVFHLRGVIGEAIGDT